MLKFTIVAAITLVLSSVAVMAINSVMAATLTQGASPYSPGAKINGESPSDPYRNAPGQVVQNPSDPYIPSDPYRNSAGQQFLAAGGVSGGPG